MASNLKGIAEKLGVSVSTVSRVANGKGCVSKEMRRKVESALKKDNYVPDQIARSLRIRSTKTVGVIVPDIRDYFSNIIKGVDSILYGSGYSILLADTGENSEREKHYLKMFIERRVDGLILATVSDDDRCVRPFFEQGIPIVFFDNLPKLSCPYNAVILDNVMASRMAVNHLVEEGHRRIAIICGDTTETTGGERLHGYKQAMREHGLQVDEHLIQQGGFSYEDGYRCMRELMRKRGEHDFSAVYVISCTLTYGALKALQELKMRCPEDVAIVGFDFPDQSGLITPEITTVLQPIEEIGRELANHLIFAINQAARPDAVRDFSYKKIVLAPTLKIGGSSRYIPGNH